MRHRDCYRAPPARGNLISMPDRRGGPGLMTRAAR
jgi:hypothetical protein